MNRESLSVARRNSRDFGFTLVEMLMVLLILGIAAAIVVPMAARSSDMDTGAAARQLTSDLLYAQNYAITRQRRVQVSFNPATGSYTLAELSAAGSATTLINPVTRRPYVVSFPAGALKGVNLASSAAGTTFVFTSLGAPEQPGSVTLTSGNSSRQVVVAPVTGKITVE